MTEKQMEKKFQALEKRVAKLEQHLKRGNSAKLHQTQKRPRAFVSERARARDLLRRAGITRAMTDEEIRLAAEWRALSGAEQREVDESLRRARLDPPLSQLIHDMRG